MASNDSSLLITLFSSVLVRTAAQAVQCKTDTRQPPVLNTRIESCQIVAIISTYQRGQYESTLECPIELPLELSFELSLKLTLLALPLNYLLNYPLRPL